MINCKNFVNSLMENGIDFFTGVPDSLLKDFCAYIYDNIDEKNNIVAANEGSAVSLAAGYHLSTGKTGLVYMQNSGQGNAINPLVSLMDSDVYKIPVLLLIGWRGEPGKKDEPQHIKQGKITLDLLETLGIPWKVLSENDDETDEIIKDAVDSINSKSGPYAIVIKKGTFESYNLKNTGENRFELSREEAIKRIVDLMDPADVIVSTTGKTSRELFEYREEKNQEHSRDFLTVGSMGHSSQIALAIALTQASKNIYCIDGDGAFIMHMGALTTIGEKKPENYKHIIINNGAHDSVGGQPTAGFLIDIPGVAKACGYRYVCSVDKKDELDDKILSLKNAEGPVLLEIKVNRGARDDLGRPTTTPVENKIEFMKFLKDE